MAHLVKCVPAFLSAEAPWTCSCQAGPHPATPQVPNAEDPDIQPDSCELMMLLGKGTSETLGPHLHWIQSI